jgi:beta-glucanase (GH16 family)
VLAPKPEGTVAVKMLVKSCSAVCFAFLSLQAMAAWEPTFVDNFDGTELDLQSWVPDGEVLPRRVHYYDKDALEVADGQLHIKVLNRAESDRPYTTGLVSTQGLFKQQYGYFEIRAKIPKGKGFWPAFWLMPTSGLWTSEIDISEFRGHLTDTVHYAFHYGNRLRNENSFTAQLPLDLSDSYNTFAVHWTPSRIDYLLNGEVMHSLTDPETISNANTDMFLILNLGLASQHSGWIPTVDRDSDLSQSYSIEYVRVYKEVAEGRYASIPAATDPIGDIRGVPYDNTALAVDRGEQPGLNDIMRTPGHVAGSVKLTAHKANYRGLVSVVLTQLSNFNAFDGRYEKSASLETRNFDVSLAQTGESRQIDYSFDTFISTPGVYAVDILIKDLATQSKKRLGGHRIVQYVDANQPGTTVWLDGFFREGSATYAGGAVNATLQLQLQQALLTPYLDIQYELVDTVTGDVLLRQAERLEHGAVGLHTLSPTIAAALDPSRSIGLVVSASDASGIYPIARYGVPVAGTAPPPAWNPDPGPVSPIVAGGTIPLQTWEPTFVDNFDDPGLDKGSWVPGLEQSARRISYYDKDALRVENGLLKIDVLNRPDSDRPYTTGAISTQGQFKQRYGYFEIRAKIPAGNGFWPAFWLMPESGRWTSEIDVAEFRGQLPDSGHYAFHYGHRLRNENAATVQLAGDLSESFNNFAVYWTPERIDYLFNGTIVHSVVGAQTVANAQSEMFLILNLALSSQHASGWIPVVDETTDLSQSFEIDYVRVYQADPTGRYVGIPGPQESVADIGGNAYDNTALAVERLKTQGEVDILRAPAQISGALEVTSHRDDYSGVVSVILVELTEFDRVTGRYTKSASIEATNFAVVLANTGDTGTLNYAFSPLLAGPGVYAVDVMVRDSATDNKKTLTGHRVVQFVDPSRPDTTVFFEGFFRDAAAHYNSGIVQAAAQLQLQQALLTPYLNVEYRVVDALSGVSVTSFSQSYEHQEVGLLGLTASLNAVLAEDRDYDLHIDVTDSSGAYPIESVVLPISGANSHSSTLSLPGT